MEEETPEVEEEVEAAIDALREDEEDTVDDEILDEVEPEQPKETIEDIATELGWRPKDSFNDDDKEFLSASEFIRKGNKLRASASKGLKETQKKLESMESAILDIKKHYSANTKAQEARHRKEIEKLKEKRIEAIEEADPDKVDALEEEIAERYNAMEEYREPQFSGPNPSDVETYDEWLSENTWYAPTGKGGDIERTLYADEEAAKLERYPDLPYARKLEIVTKKVEERFAKKDPTKPTVNTVESPRPGKPKGKYPNLVLSKEEMRIGRSLVNNGDMTWDEYKKDVAEQREA